MKLKKIASLALAGVMAVSMLAGCKYGEGSSSSSSSEPVVDSSLAGQVIANLAAKTTKYTTFSSNGSHLQLVLSDALEGAGTAKATTLKGSDLVAVDSTIGSAAYMPAIESTKTSSNSEDSKIQKLVFVVSDIASSDASAAYKLAKKIDALDTTDNSVKGYIGYTSRVWDNLYEKSLWDDESLDDATYYWTFAYTADVAVEKVTDPETGVTAYVAAVVVTRTPTKVEL